MEKIKKKSPKIHRHIIVKGIFFLGELAIFLNNMSY